MIWLVAAAALLVAAANGANDNVKGVATLLGSGTLTRPQARLWGTLTTWAGSAAAVAWSGTLLARFTGHGLVPDVVVTQPEFMAAVALASAGTVLLATRIGFPISTTHALTGALIGAGSVLAGPWSISYAALGGRFLAPLLFGPVIALLASAAAWKLLRLAPAAPQAVCVCAAPEPVTIGIGQPVVVTPGGGLQVGPSQACQDQGARELVTIGVRDAGDLLHLVSAAAVGFARGLNDTPKIAALLAAGGIGGTPGLLGVGLAMAAGGVLAGRRVDRRMAFEITPLGRAEALTSNAVTAILVGAASPLGLPVSTTHVSCGALFGLGAATGGANWRSIAGIAAAWVVTLPVSALLAGLLARALEVSS